MITTLIIFLLVTLVLLAVRLPVLEGALGLLLISSLVGWTAGTMIGVGGYPAAFVLVLGGVLALRGGSWRALLNNLSAEKLWPVLLWISTFIFTYSLTQWWPDFISIGERLRDYALLSAVFNYPFEAREPWMVGAPLNYYLFWYRFGHFLAVLGDLPVWTTYHVLQAFVVASYLSLLAVITRNAFKVPVAVACVISVLVTFGSNLAGIEDAFTGKPGWWGPSRVITGTINEFPAWSFLLGDLHPHFLNLPLMPLIILIGLSYEILVIPVFLTGLFLVFSANAWELPVALIFAVMGVFALVLKDFSVQGRSLARYISEIRSRLADFFLRERGPIAGTVIIAALVSVCAFISAKHISPPSDPVRFVNLGFLNPVVNFFASVLSLASGRFTEVNVNVHGSDLSEFLMHWGVPLALISITNILSAPYLLKAVGLLASLALSYYLNIPLPYLIFLVVIVAHAIFLQVFRSSQISLLSLGVLLVGLGSVIAIAIPEVLFIDDPYGGENERMNTVFKFYSAAWGPLHIFAFGSFVQFFWGVKVSLTSRIPGIAVTSVCGLLLLGFFVSTLDERSQKDFRVSPKERGLSSIDREFPGSAATIERLSAMPRGVVLEAVFGAYNYSGFVSTLASKDSYMGWVNHVGLLTKMHDEAGRRERLAKEFYQSQSCSERLATAQREGIRYVVVGALERQNYGPAVDGSFDCLRLSHSSGQYKLYEVR